MEFSFLSAMSGVTGFMRMDRFALDTARACRSLGKQAMSFAKRRGESSSIAGSGTPITKLGKIDSYMKEEHEFLTVSKKHITEVKNALEVLNNGAVKYDIYAKLNRKDLESMKKAFAILVNEAKEFRVQRDSRLNEDIVNKESNITASKPRNGKCQDDMPHEGDKKPKKRISRLLSMMRHKLTSSEIKLNNKKTKKGKNKSDSQIGDFSDLVQQVKSLPTEAGPQSLLDKVQKQSEDKLVTSHTDTAGCSFGTTSEGGTDGCASMASESIPARCSHDTASEAVPTGGILGRASEVDAVGCILGMVSKTGPAGCSVSTTSTAGPSGCDLATTSISGPAGCSFGTSVVAGCSLGNVHTYSEETLTSEYDSEEDAYQHPDCRFYREEFHKPSFLACGFFPNHDTNSMASTSAYVPCVRNKAYRPSSSKYTLYEQKMRAALRAIDDAFDQSGSMNKKMSKSFDGYMNKLIDDDQDAKFSVAYDIVQDAPTDIYF